MSFLVAAVYVLVAFSVICLQNSTVKDSHGSLHVPSGVEACFEDTSSCMERTADHLMVLFSDLAPTALTVLIVSCLAALAVLVRQNYKSAFKEDVFYSLSRLKFLMQRWKDIFVLLPLVFEFRKGIIQPKIFA